MKKKIRKVGDITSDMEQLLSELAIDHDMQHGEVLALVYSWLKIHAPDQQETYLDGTHPVYNYGPK